jgi:hypothetical protein
MRLIDDRHRHTSVDHSTSVLPCSVLPFSCAVDSTMYTYGCMQVDGRLYAC